MLYGYAERRRLSLRPVLGLDLHGLPLPRGPTGCGHGGIEDLGAAGEWGAEPHLGHPGLAVPLRQADLVAL